MAISRLVSTIALGLTVVTAATLAQTAPPRAEEYSWADSCRSCHEKIYDAWAKTKHASALDRLSTADQEKECIGCHVTGPKSPVIDGKKVLNRGVQCEACHGGAAAHAADPNVRTGLTKIPTEALCQQCHSEKSPKFKGFFYSAMLGLCHKVG
jgi:hypothetical protein